MDIALLDISKTSSFADYFVVATAQSPLHFNALSDHLERELKKDGHDLRHKEGTAASGWVLMDFSDLIVHLFSPEKRDFYRIEELWGKAAPVVHFTG